MIFDSFWNNQNDYKFSLKTRKCFYKSIKKNIVLSSRVVIVWWKKILLVCRRQSNFYIWFFYVLNRNVVTSYGEMNNNCHLCIDLQMSSFMTIMLRKENGMLKWLNYLWYTLFLPLAYFCMSQMLKITLKVRR